jgi:chromosome segregation ATPase
VSTWLVYADGIRHHIEAAMRGQTVPPTTDEQVSRPASPASLRTDLELAREEIRSLRAERDKLRQAARLHLGQQLDQLGSKDLIARIDELTGQNSHLDAVLRRVVAENDAYQQRVIELEDDLSASRTSLRRMIRTDNQQVR